MTEPTQEFNKALVIQAHATRNTHDADAVAQYFAEDVVNHDALPDSPSGREGSAGWL